MDLFKIDIKITISKKKFITFQIKHLINCCFIYFKM